MWISLLLLFYRITGDESLLLEIFDKFVNELKEKAKEKDRKRQEDKVLELL